MTNQIKTEALLALYASMPLAEMINQTLADPFEENYSHNLEGIQRNIQLARVSRKLREGGTETYNIVQVVYVEENAEDLGPRELGIRIYHYDDKALMRRVTRELVRTLRNFGYFVSSDTSEITFRISIRSRKPANLRQRLRYSRRLDGIRPLIKSGIELVANTSFKLMEH